MLVHPKFVNSKSPPPRRYISPGPLRSDYVSPPIKPKSSPLPRNYFPGHSTNSVNDVAGTSNQHSEHFVDTDDIDVLDSVLQKVAANPLYTTPTGQRPPTWDDEPGTIQARKSEDKKIQARKSEDQTIRAKKSEGGKYSKNVYKKVGKKEVLGKDRVIYKMKGSNKEYLKTKGMYIPVSEYKKLKK